jgi:ABC-type lipoprotein release transport system permease subunit
MITLTKIAWRNLWRNKRRTLITIASVFFALFLSLLMRSMQYGSYEMMKRDAVRNSTGYIQIHAPGYWDDKTIDNTFEASDELFQKVASSANVSDVIPRLESFALASSGNISKGVGIIGTIPETEAEITKLAERVVSGTYFKTPTDPRILIGEELAKYLEVGLFDTVTLLSQGYHGSSAAADFQITGILHFPSPEMNRQLIYMSLETSQYFFAAPGRLTSYSLLLHDIDKLDETANSLKATVGEGYEIMTWEKMMVEIKQHIDSDNISGMFMLAILYIVVAFGIFGTILMITHERRKEFSIMIAVGMKREKLSFIVFMETLFIGFIGIVTGIVLSIPIVHYFYLNPIPLTGEMADMMLEYNMQPLMPFSNDPAIFVAQSLIVLILTIIIATYPFVKIMKFNLIRGLKE